MNIDHQLGKIPTEIDAYVLPTQVQEELNETIQAVETQNIIKTYRVDGEDLNSYERSGDYVQGKINPFDKIAEGTTGNSNGNTDENFSSSSGGSQSENGSQGNFLNVIK